MTVKIVELLETLDRLKHLKRTGWVKMGIPEPETVAGHMYRMAMLGMAMHKEVPDVDATRVVYMSLMHDIAEATVGDITPFCGVSEEEKHRLEKEAMQTIASYVPNSSVEWFDLWAEYEENKTLTAKVVKQLDKFDMIAQAFDYEKKYGIDLQQFFDSTKTVFSSEPFMRWNVDLRERREEWLKNKIE